MNWTCINPAFGKYASLWRSACGTEAALRIFSPKYKNPGLNKGDYDSFMSLPGYEKKWVRPVNSLGEAAFIPAEDIPDSWEVESPTNIWQPVNPKKPPRRDRQLSLFA